MSSEAKNDEEFALEIIEKKHQQWHGLKDILKLEFLRLVRIRDFISLILMYPMTMPGQHSLRKWRDDAQALTAIYSEHIDSVGVLKVSGAYRWMHLLSEKPLKNMEVLIPNDILSKIEDGHRSIFNENAAILTWEAVAFTSIGKGNEVHRLANVHNLMPKATFNLAANLAVDQLIQTLLSCSVHHVMFSTRNGVEKIDVMRKIEAALNDGHNRTTISTKYSRVLWVDASKYSNNTEFRVQQEIARQLDLMTSKEGQTKNNEILLARLIEVEMMKMNHLVILVDGDVDGKVDLWKVGFPKKMLAGVVVFLTVEPSELTMTTDLEIRIEDHMIPWELFCRNVGRELVSSSSDIQRIAVQIVEECRGHLHAIVLVARSLKNKEDVELWKLALKELRCLHPLCGNANSCDINKAMVNAFVNIIWNNLNKTKKLCLACSLYILRLKENMADHLLISSWVYNKLVYSREEAAHILKDFVHRCILLQYERKYIRWPEEIYDVLRSFLLKFPPLNTIKKGGLGLTEIPTAGEWLSTKHIELMDNKLLELPPSPSWPEVTQLLLQRNLCCYTSIGSLPSSFFNLTELKELHLRGCKRLMELPPQIGQLKNLEILNIDNTPITHLPEQVQELTRLKKLILSFYACHDMMKSLRYLVPPMVISKLAHLHYLSIDVNPVNRYWDENIQVILHDIFELQELNTLSLYIPQVELLKYVPTRLDFRFVVGHHIQQRIISRAPLAVEAKFKQHSYSLRFANGVNISNDIFKVIQCSKALFLERHRTIINLSQIDMGSLAHLLLFMVGECNEMQTLIDEGCSLCPDLCWRFLCVFYMNNLRSICNVEACFYSLKTILLHNCPKLTVIFTLNFLLSLVNLEELVVEDCPKVSTLMTLESIETKDGIFLPSLRKVSLLYLPELVSISSGLCIRPNLERIGFYDCPKLQILFAKELGSQNLKVIKGEKEWWEALKWEEAGWGKEGRPDYLNNLFFPINEETNTIDQLLEDEECLRSHKKEVWVENLVEETDIFFTLNDEAKIMDSSGHSAQHTGKKMVMKLDLHDDGQKLEAMETAAGLAGNSGMVNALTGTQVQDGYVSYPWERRMQELLSIPNSGNFLSILLLPKASNRVASRYNDLEDTRARANAWLNAAQASGVPIVFLSIQTESLLTKISGETASYSLNAGSLSDLSNNIANASLYGVEDYQGVDLGIVRAARLWYAPIGGELSIEIKLKESDAKLGFAISRTEEGFIYISSVIDNDETLPAKRSGLSNLYKIATETSRLLVVSRVSNHQVLPWTVSSTGAIRCYDTVSISQKLSLQRHARVPIVMHVFLWDKAMASSRAAPPVVTPTVLPLPPQVQFGRHPNEDLTIQAKN